MLGAGFLINRKYHTLWDFPGVVCAFSSRICGNMSLFYGNTGNALENRKGFLKELNIDYHSLVCAKQVHASTVRYVRQPDKGKGALSYEDSIPSTDALITDEKNVPLSIFTADCLSIFLYDAKNHCIGLAHAGWRSSRETIAARTVKLMQEEFNTATGDLYAGFGPAIRSCCYEVGEELAGSFTSGCVIKRGRQNYLDLVEINKRQLLAEGVRDKNIFDSKICTACRNAEFFSYRKEGAGCGRIMSVMMLK